MRFPLSIVWIQPLHGAAGWQGTPLVAQMSGTGLAGALHVGGMAVPEQRSSGTDGQRDRGMSLRQRDPAELRGQLPWVRASSHPHGTAHLPPGEVRLGAASHGRSPSPTLQIQLLPRPKPHFFSKNSSFFPAGSLCRQLVGCLKRPWGYFAAPLIFPPTPLLPAHLPSCPLRVTQPVAHPGGTVAPRAPLGIVPSLGKRHPQC